MTEFKRARSEQTKQIRLTAILDSVESMISKHNFEACNLNHIAAEVNITKTALYRYFRNKELIFLELYKRELEALIPNLTNSFSPPDPEKITQSFVDRPVFCKLNSILSTVLEQPLTEEECLIFKRHIAATLTPVVIAIVEHFQIKQEEAIDWLMHLFAALVGCWHIGNPSPVMRQALESPDINFFQQDFALALQRHITILLTELSEHS